jgi:hypothetical protein
MGGVKLEHGGQSVDREQVIDAHNLEIIALHQYAEDQTSYTAEAVNSNLGSHLWNNLPLF